MQVLPILARLEMKVRAELGLKRGLYVTIPQFFPVPLSTTINYFILH